MTNSKEELDRRRRNGRLAQSAFRARQAETKKRMVEQNAQLKKAIEEILQVVRPSDPALLRSRIQAAATLAGVEADLTATTETDAGTAVASTVTEPVTKPVTKPVTAETDADAEQVPVAASTTDTVSVSYYNNINIYFHPQLQINVPIHKTACLLPFLGPGALTLAGCIVWHIVGLKGGGKNYGGLPAPSLPARLQIIAYYARSPAPLEHMGPAQWSAIIDSWLESCCQGTVPVTSSPSHLSPDLVTQWHAQQWLSPIEVEQRIRTAVGESVFAMLTAPLQERCETEMAHIRKGELGITSSNQAYISAGQCPNTRGGTSDLVDGLLDMLSEIFICFGIGPLWNCATLNDSLQSWCTSVINRTQPLCGDQLHLPDTLFYTSAFVMLANHVNTDPCRP